MVSYTDKRKFLRILIELKEKHANTFTQQEIADYLHISLRKVNSFLNGKNYDFWLLIHYGALIGVRVDFYINEARKY